MQIEVVDRPVDGARVDGVVGRIARQLIGAERTIDDAERACAVRAAAIAENGGEVLAGELDHFRHLRKSDRAALRVERMVITAVEVDAPSGQLIKTERPLLAG